MSPSYQFLLYFHITMGFASLVVFWIPVIVKKGSALHIRIGHWYAKIMYLVAASAFVLALMLIIDPIGFKFSDSNFDTEESTQMVSEFRNLDIFLLAISVLVSVGVRHGLQAVRAKANHALMRRADNLAINFALLGVGVWLGFTATGNSPLNVLFYIFAGLCSYTAISNLYYCSKPNVTRGEQIIAHLSAIIGAGIGSHTAFFVFGASRALAGVLTGYLTIIPWVLPGIVGTVLILRQAKKYRPRKTESLKLD